MATVETSVERGVGTILLNRPAALNALDASMYEGLTSVLDAWYDDPRVRAVTMRGAGKAFCAGGDVRFTLETVRSGDAARVDELYRQEYGIDGLIHRYPKPIIAVIDGVCMGGGMGLAMHAQYRLVSERALLAMPETELGFFPDCGVAWLLARLRGAVGTYLALTGARLSASDARRIGLATHTLAADRVDDVERVVAACVESADIDVALSELGGDLPDSALAPNLAAIDETFALDSVPAIVAALERDGSAWAGATLATLRRMSPTALVVTLELLRRERTMTLPRAFEFEGRLAGPLSHTGEYAEGVRAVIIDKDRKPKWHPARLEDVDHAAVMQLLDRAEAGT